MGKQIFPAYRWELDMPDSSALELFKFRLKDLNAAQSELVAAAKLSLTNPESQAKLAAACNRMNAAIRDYQSASKAVPNANNFW